MNPDEKLLNNFRLQNKEDLKFTNVTGGNLDNLVNECDDLPVQSLCNGCAYNCTLKPGCYRVSAPIFTYCKCHGRPECGFPVYTGCCVEMKCPPPC